MDGVLVIDKPAGPTSHDVVARVRRALGLSRIGHTGTLDPLATGVLPLVIGRATRLASLFSATEKEYEAAVRLGAATETYDAAHRVGPAPPAPEGIDAARIERALDAFRGTYAQTPPPFSAKKIAGVPAYKLARRNDPVELRAVTVTVSELSLISYADGLACLRVRSSAGFYVRSLAHELGERLGCGAYLESLRRLRAGPFDEAVAVALATVEAQGRDAGQWVIPMNRLLSHVPAVVLNDRGVRRATHGNDVALDDLAVPSGTPLAPGTGPGEAGFEAPVDALTPGRWRLLDEEGALLAIAESRPGGALHPVIVLV
jgi:tRNA pseudouridine55 synthase